MDGIHDMGGVEGYGSVPYVPEEPISTGERWEAFTAAAFFALERSGTTNIDAHRHRIERIDPDRYLPISYWGRWLVAVEAAVVEQGVVTTDEVEGALAALGRDPEITAPPPRLHPNDGLEAQGGTRSFVREVGQPPRFATGDRVRVRAHAPHRGHHRLPRYVRGRTGTVARVYPAFTLPDTMAHGRGEAPAYVYAVAFAASELWGLDADPNQICHLDLFEPYLVDPPPGGPTGDEEEQPADDR